MFGIDGYKTYIGGACFILNGIAQAGISWYNGQVIDWNVVMASVGTGLGIIGIGHKIEKKVV